MSTSRKQALVRAAKARAAILANVSDVPSFPDDLLPCVGDNLSMDALCSLLDRMGRNGLINKVPHTKGRFKVAYTRVEGGRVMPEKYSKKARQVFKSTAPVLDMVVRKDGRGVSLMLAGLKLNISVEE